MVAQRDNLEHVFYKRAVSKTMKTKNKKAENITVQNADWSYSSVVVVFPVVVLYHITTLQNFKWGNSCDRSYLALWQLRYIVIHNCFNFSNKKGKIKNLLHEAKSILAKLYI